MTSCENNNFVVLYVVLHLAVLVLTNRSMHIIRLLWFVTFVFLPIPYETNFLFSEILWNIFITELFDRYRFGKKNETFQKSNFTVKSNLDHTKNRSVQFPSLERKTFCIILITRKPRSFHKLFIYFIYMINLKKLNFFLFNISLDIYATVVV